jgi:hypothetical protein
MRKRPAGPGPECSGREELSGNGRYRGMENRTAVRRAIRNGPNRTVAERRVRIERRPSRTFCGGKLEIVPGAHVRSKMPDPPAVRKVEKMPAGVLTTQHLGTLTAARCVLAFPYPRRANVHSHAPVLPAP